MRNPNLIALSGQPWGGETSASEMWLRWMTVRLDTQELWRAAARLEPGSPGLRAAWQAYEALAEIEVIFRLAYEAARDGEVRLSRG